MSGSAARRAARGREARRRGRSDVPEHSAITTALLRPQHAATPVPDQQDDRDRRTDVQPCGEAYGAGGRCELRPAPLLPLWTAPGQNQPQRYSEDARWVCGDRGEAQTGRNRHRAEVRSPVIRALRMCRLRSSTSSRRSRQRLRSRSAPTVPRSSQSPSPLPSPQSTTAPTRAASTTSSGATTSPLSDTTAETSPRSAIALRSVRAAR